MSFLDSVVSGFMVTLSVTSKLLDISSSDEDSSYKAVCLIVSLSVCQFLLVIEIFRK